MKYKITKEEKINSNGNKNETFFIKKRIFGLWFYSLEDTFDCDSIGEKIFTTLFEVMLFSLVSLLIITGIFALLQNFFTSINIFIGFGIILLILYNIYYVFSYCFRFESYSQYKAEDRIKNIIKRKKFTRKTFDVVEITTKKDKIIIKK